MAKQKTIVLQNPEGLWISGNPRYRLDRQAFVLCGALYGEASSLKVSDEAREEFSVHEKRLERKYPGDEACHTVLITVPVQQVDEARGAINNCWNFRNSNVSAYIESTEIKGPDATLKLQLSRLDEATTSLVVGIVVSEIQEAGVALRQDPIITRFKLPQPKSGQGHIPALAKVL